MKWGEKKKRDGEKGEKNENEIKEQGERKQVRKEGEPRSCRAGDHGISPVVDAVNSP